MKILLIGSGGREHAIAHSLKRSPSCTKLFIAPGNPGTARLGENVNLDSNNHSAIEKFCTEMAVELVVIGPENPLAEGLGDFLRKCGIPVCGPGKAGADLEASKDYSKAFMLRHDIPTAKYKSFKSGEEKEANQYIQNHSIPIVVKASGLAAGKGVVICEDRNNAERIVHEMLSGSVFGNAGRTVVIEEFLSGIEVSVFILTDGTDYILLPEAKDYKRIFEGDKGPNTGGMGAVSPVPFADADFMQKVKSKIIDPTIKGLKEEAIPYRGFIFFGLISVLDEPYVIEYNCRMGDPESEVVFPRILSDMAEILFDCAIGQLGTRSLLIDPRDCVTVMMVSKGYPEAYEKGKEIQMKGDQPDENLVFHAGTRLEDEKLLTNGGRVLAVTAFGNTRSAALQNAYRGIKSISFEGHFYRRDIGKDLGE